MKVFWKTAPKPGNFGDILTPYVLNHFGFDYTHDVENYNTLAIGSIAAMAKPGTTVLGSGLLKARQDLCPESNWQFVRGPITRQRVIECGGTCPEIYGDLALLLPLLQEPSDKKYSIGIVPHYVDYDYVKELCPQYRVINLLNSNPLAVAKEITECEKIVSSSLHGIICAHAYSIPTAWVQFSDKLLGGNLKFFDYYRSLNIEPEHSTMDDLKFTSPAYNVQPIIDIMNRLSNEQKQ